MRLVIYLQHKYFVGLQHHNDDHQRNSIGKEKVKNLYDSLMPNLHAETVSRCWLLAVLWLWLWLMNGSLKQNDWSTLNYLCHLLFSVFMFMHIAIVLISSSDSINLSRRCHSSPRISCHLIKFICRINTFR